MSLCRVLNCLGSHTKIINSVIQNGSISTCLRRDSFSTSSVKNDLMEFFDNEKNWGVKEVQVGRSWKLEELRIKSNSDLHKLWYVLLKERNMLLTMEHEYNAQFKAFPNPERIDKVEESMENLETVVRERNRAYFELETGESGERPSVELTNCFGLPYKRRMTQHFLPKNLNKKFLETEKFNNEITNYKDVKDFLTRLNEKKKNMELFRAKKNYRVVCNLLKRFPNMDEEALKEQFPDVNIKKAKKDKLSRGHRENL